jgi:integrase/recombinase XerD
MPTNLKLRGGVWWFRKRIAGEDYEESLQTGSVSVAKDRRDELLQRLRENGAGKRWRDARKRTFDDAAAKFAAEHYGDLKRKSCIRYSASIRNLAPTFEGVLLSDIGSAKLSEFEQVRRAQGVTDATILRDLACLSVIFTFAEIWEWGVVNPVKPYVKGRKLTGLSEGQARTRYLAHDEEAEILKFAPPKALRAFILLLDTGLRKEELYALKWPDVDFRNRELFIRGNARSAIVDGVASADEGTKSRRDRYVLLWPRALELLKVMKAEMADLRSPYVFQTQAGGRYSNGSPTHYEALQGAVRRASKAREAAGRQPIPHVELHDLRRTCGCRLLQDHGFSMEEVSMWLGHSSIKVTERHYAFLSKAELHKARKRSEARQAREHLGQKSGHRRYVFRRRPNKNSDLGG